MNIHELDKSTQEYFYSLPSLVQEKIANSNVHVTCPEDLQRYFRNEINAVNHFGPK